MVKYLSFHNSSSFALRYLLSNVNGKAAVWHTPCLSISCNRSFIGYRSTTPLFLCTINPHPPSMQQLFNKIIKCGLHNPLFFCKTAFSHQPKLNFLLLRLWWPRGKKAWCIRWQGKEGCNPMFIINCCWCQLLWRWIMIFLCVGLNEYLLSLLVLITTFLNSYVSRFVHYRIHALSNLSLLSPLSTFQYNTAILSHK